MALLLSIQGFLPQVLRMAAPLFIGFLHSCICIKLRVLEIEEVEIEPAVALF